MTCEYRWSEKCVVKTFSGFVSGAEFIRSAETVAASIAFDDLRVIYNDFLAIDGHSIDADAYTQVAASRAGA